MWYSNSYRRNLVDMHIEDWSPEFLSRFDPDAYYDCLATGEIQSPMIYLQSHAGHCYFPTKAGHMHRALNGREDLVKRLVDKCRANGMDVVGYYSLIYNTCEEDRHPEWKIHDGGGKSKRDMGGRYGLCCPNNMQYRAFVFEQIKEMADFFTVDGMFYDMLFWPDLCRCDACKARFAAEVGGDIPVEIDWKDERWLAYDRKRREWMGEFAMAVTLETKRLMPGVSVEHNYANAVSSNWSNATSELINEACDYTGGDLYGDLYNHSFTCKYYMNITKNTPFEYMTCRCDNRLNQHTVTKSESALETEIMLTAAHHGASFIIDAIDPRGTMDKRVYERIGNIFRRHKRYEPWFAGEHVSDVSVYYGTTSRYNADGQKFTSKDCAINTVKTLIENHVPVSVVSAGCPEKIDSCKYLVVPAIYELDPAISDRMINYVQNGGALYFSGAGNPKLLRTLIGGAYAGEMTRETVTYLSPTRDFAGLFGEFNRDYPMPFFYKLPVVTAPDEGVAAYITLPYTARADRKFASIHSDPPGIETRHPGLIVKPFGKGHVVWSAAPLELDDRSGYKRLMMDLLGLHLKPEALTVRTDAPKNVELVSFRTDEGFFVNAVDLKCTEELIPLHGFTVSVASPNAPAAVSTLPDEQPVPFSYENGRISFESGEFAMQKFFRVLLKK